ncbi:MAG: hypothetical protein A3C07_03800 [Candidatus Sungbacteria bacterium RIFCSPHIGHO2_02_FULL_47_11]|uniref:tRNA-dihydrouridine synthase n=1 Tax=Candidatus Sungbacteria bacterium RIFCSPHIGHO2_02_FULL_47_11 TaxID=1802270 RepID=A0A1G2KN65_9BACT|nr:MAG: hypothetical protein A3C07_03800 [Candidatus Sungbacteria bacterium RIFCSPHIGHO2_02_FULL_47_11]
MSQGFWGKLQKPIMALAPMADVTDAAFRRLIANYSGFKNPEGNEKGFSHVMYTEFVSADGLFSPGRDVLMKDLLFSETERPIVAQFFTARPELMEKAAALAMELGFDGVDINMGCPDRGVEKQGAGAALIKNPTLARELIRAAKKGAGPLPVSVKTRIGYNKNEIETWLPELLAEEPAAVIIHARTRKEMSAVPAHWDVVTRAVEIRDSLKNRSLVLGNGDVSSVDEAKKKAEETGADGVMLGRAIFGNPWMFTGYVPTTEEKLKVMVEHTKLFEELFMHHKINGASKNFAVMKKHYKAYANGFPAAKELRIKLMETKNACEVEIETNSYLQTLN